MKAIISSTYNSKYLYFLPIVTWCWNKLGVDVICFMPKFVHYEKGQEGLDIAKRIKLVEDTVMNHCSSKSNMLAYFDAPEHKEATYSQCSRLYGACLDLPEDEVLISSDVDMAVFKLPTYAGFFSIHGYDLVPEGQYPICYVSSEVRNWRACMEINGRTYQECLDDLLGGIEAEHFRGNYWGKDQETLFNNAQKNVAKVEIKRARPNTQFADNRVDRDDINWRAYVNEDLVDAHLWRDGYTDENHANIMELMRMKFPDEDFTWLDNYRNEYLKLL